ncbi:MAG TPA: glycoside hydrolase family 15 protein [Actinomycetota bacterium]|nr:glycoside hydrolase family 15 protein [Actinomycetota bacterium]
MRDPVRTSVEVLARGQDPGGAFVAAPGFPVYRYCWIRDGSFCAHALDAVAEHARAAAFHRWTAAVVLQHRGKVERLGAQAPPPGRPPDDAAVLHTRFRVDGTEGREPWSNFQLDGYGLWLSALGLHLQATGGDPSPYREAVGLVVRYLAALWDRPCWNCWEEHPDRIHPTTVAAVARGLERAAAILEDDGAAAIAVRARARLAAVAAAAGGVLPRFEGSEAVDGSALLVFGPFGPFDPGDPVVRATVGRIEAELVAEGAGVHRYLGDGYYGGGLWVPLAGALALARARLGDGPGAREAVAWIEGTADAHGLLPEQVPRHLQRPELLPPWEGRWGPVARPLLWSHAMHLLARAALG